MRRGILVTWHAVSLLAAGALFFFFVLPRWPELMGDVSHTWGTVLRVGTGILLALTALPVVFSLVKSRRPEFGTPQLALSLRVWSIVGQVLAGVLIVIAAVVEIWVSLDTAGPVLFGVYGAAAAIAVLGALAFYLALAAETAPPPPKPLKPKKTTQGGGDTTPADRAEPEAEAEATVDDTVEADEEVDDEAEAPAEVVAEASDEVTETEPSAEDEAKTDEPRRRLRNRRPSGKTGRGGVALSD